MTEREALKLALEKKCENCGEFGECCQAQFSGSVEQEPEGNPYDDQRRSMEQAFKEPEQEPVAIVDANDEGYWADILPNRSVKVGQHLYTTPPQRSEERAYKPLTDEQIKVMWRCSKIYGTNEEKAVAFARAIEAAHGIKGDS